MAKGIFGSGLQGMTGSTNKRNGGDVFSKNGVIRRRVIPVQPNTIKQGTVKGIFAVITVAWSTLGQAIQSRFNDAASSGAWKIHDDVMGVQRNPGSGKELFQHLNGNIAAALRNTTGLLTDVPNQYPAGNTVATEITVVDDGGAAEVFATYTGALGVNELHVFEFSKGLSPGTSKFKKNSVRFLVANTTASPANLSAAWAANDDYFGNPVEGQKISYRIKAIDQVSGQSRLVGSGIVEVATA